MIRVVFDAAGRTLTAEGHAGYAPEGQDIVCSAVSALMYGAWNALSDLYMHGDMTEPPDAQVGDRGYMRLSWQPREIPDTIVRYFADAIGLVAERYHEFVKFSKFNV